MWKYGQDSLIKMICNYLANHCKAYLALYIQNVDCWGRHLYSQMSSLIKKYFNTVTHYTDFTLLQKKPWHSINRNYKYIYIYIYVLILSLRLCESTGKEPCMTHYIKNGCYWLLILNRLPVFSICILSWLKLVLYLLVFKASAIQICA